MRRLKGRSLESYFEDELDFDEVFQRLYPASLVQPGNGLTLERKIVLIHKLYRDVELGLDSRAFAWQDFWNKQD